MMLTPAPVSQVISSDSLIRVAAMFAAGGRPSINDALDFTPADLDVGREMFKGTPSRHAYKLLERLHSQGATTLLVIAA